MNIDHPARCPHAIRFEVMRMWWRNLTYVHWPFDPEDVQRLLPEGLTVDTWDDRAWVGLIPFEMEVQLPGGIPIPIQGSFPETNVRTYVVGPDGTPGVWFHSLEAGRLPATAVARLTYGLPYFWADMTVENRGSQWSYHSQRRWPGPVGARCDVRASVGSPFPVEEHSPFERYLTARWGLYSTFVNRLVYAPVVHDPWPLHRATLIDLDDELAAAAGLSIPGEEPVVHWTPGVEVRIGRPRLARAR